MKRFHMNVKVSDMEKSKDYYSALFAAQPSVAKDDYIKWMLDDPFINFSIEPASDETGIAHVGIQAENEAELQEVFARVGEAGGQNLMKVKRPAATPIRKRAGPAILTD